MIDEQQILADEQKLMTLDLLGLAAVANPDWVAQAAALLSGATVVIEREVGTARANDALAALLAPTIEAWAAAAALR